MTLRPSAIGTQLRDAERRRCHCSAAWWLDGLIWIGSRPPPTLGLKARFRMADASLQRLRYLATRPQTGYHPITRAGS